MSDQHENPAVQLNVSAFGKFIGGDELLPGSSFCPGLLGSRYVVLANDPHDPHVSPHELRINVVKSDERLRGMLNERCRGMLRPDIIGKGKLKPLVASRASSRRLLV